MKFMPVVKVICFIIVMILCLNILHWLAVDDTRSYTRLMLHEFYTQDNIDILFVGSSHCYGSLDPAVTDPIFGANTFNAGSSEQALDASFALIREAIRRYDVKQIYLEMYYHKMMNDEYRDREQLTGTYIVSDYMRPSLNKARFLLQASDPKYYINSFFPSLRERNRLLHPQEVVSLVQKKRTEPYRYYEPFFDYQTKGFVANPDEIPGGILFDTAGFDMLHTEKASEDWLRTLRDIIIYCQVNEVELILFSAPVTLFQPAAMGNYDDYIDLMNDLTAGTGVRYVDFNLCREKYFDLSPEYFADASHMNAKGAAVFSRLFAEYFTGKIPDSELFYASMKEKLAAAGPQILGVSYLDSGDGMRKMKIVSTMPEGTDFTVEFADSGGTLRTLQEASPDIYFELSQSEHGTIRITANGTVTEIKIPAEISG